MKIIAKNTVEKYNTPLVNAGNIKLADYVVGRFDDVHNQLYEDALTKFIDAQRKQENSELSLEAYSNKFKKENTIIEYKNEDYFKPSDILIISKKRPYKKQICSLGDYWNTYYYDNKTYVDDIVENNKDDNKHYEVTDINYIRGIATLESKISGDIIEVPIETLTKYNIFSDDMVMKNTFGS